LQTFASMSTEQVAAKLDEAQIANARMNDMAQVWAHPQLAARERWAQVATPVGSIPALLPPGRNSSFDYRMDAVPAVGQHTELILRELGHVDASIATLKASLAI
jgi:itaconate CoA-transferase